MIENQNKDFSVYRPILYFNGKNYKFTNFQLLTFIIGAPLLSVFTYYFLQLKINYWVYEFISTQIRPNAALIVFPFEDDYSFGILQSSFHWEWFKARCSTLTERFRYTSNTVFDSFPWPQWGNLNSLENSIKNIKKKDRKIELAINVASSARELRNIRNKIKKEFNYSLREIYRTLELPGKNLLRDAQNNLDNAVLKAYNYGLPKKMQKNDPLEFLLELNLSCANVEKNDLKIIGPGLPKFCEGKTVFYSDDCIKLNKY